MDELLVFLQEFGNRSRLTQAVFLYRLGYRSIGKKMEQVHRNCTGVT